MYVRQWWTNGAHSSYELHAKFSGISHKTTKERCWVEDCRAPQWSTEALGKEVLPLQTTCAFSSGIGCAAEVRLSRGTGESSWAALILESVRCGQGGRALRMYEDMLQDGVQPGRQTLMALLKACCLLRDLSTAKFVHRMVTSSGSESDLYLGTLLVDVYAKCGSLKDARHAFDRMPHRDVVSWNTIILGYAQTGNGQEALRLYTRMREEGVEPDIRTYLGTLKASTSLAGLEKKKAGDGVVVAKRSLETVRALHGDIQKGKMELNVFLGNMLVDAYAKCGSLHDASSVFKKMPHRTVVSWNALILGYAKLNEGEEALKLYTQMREEGVTPSDRTYVSVLKACSSLIDSRARMEGNHPAVDERCLETVRAIHRDVVRSNVESDVYVGNMLVDVYAKSGSLEDARHVFERMPYRDVVSWNAMIFNYGQMGEGEEALQLYARMQQEGVVPNDRTYVSALKACIALAEFDDEMSGSVMNAVDRQEQCVKAVRAIHADAVSRKCESDVFVSNMLVDVYTKIGMLAEARNVFEKMPHRDVVSWNAIISGYAQMSKGADALQIFGQMQLDGVAANERTYVGALKACSALVVGSETRNENEEGMCAKESCLEVVKALHAQIVEGDFESDVFVGTMLVDVYAKCGSPEDARRVFEKMPHRTIVSWTAMIMGYAQTRDRAEDALQLFARMRADGVVPNDRTFVCVLKACASLVESVQKNEPEARRAKERCLEIARGIHHRGVVEGQLDVFVGTTLVDVYAKCGSMVEARNVFEEMPYRDPVTWNTIILGYALEDKGEEALQLFDRMQQEGIVPGEQTYVAALKACSSLAQLEERRGVVDEKALPERCLLDTVRSIHEDIVEGGFESDVFVGTMLVDAYTKCGSLEGAIRVFNKMPVRDVVSWNAMILGYANMDKSEEALQLFCQMRQEGVLPDDRTFVSALKACSGLAGGCQHLKIKAGGGAMHHLTRCLETVRGIHEDIVAARGEDEVLDVFVGNLLVDVYVKCGSLEDAREVFEHMHHKRTVVSWAAIIFGYAQMSDKGEEALQLFARMQQEGFRPDARTYIGALKACISLAESSGEGNGMDDRPAVVKVRCLEIVRGIHMNVVHDEFEADVFVATMLVDVYAKLGSLEEANVLFEKMPDRTVVSWNALISGHAQMGKCQEALELFSRMQQEGVVPDERTYVSALKACGGSGAGLDKGRGIHAQILDAGLETMDSFVTHSLIDMYAKCGSMMDAQRVFDGTQRRDVVAWNALMTGYANQGESEEVLELFQKMEEEGVRPDAITFLSVLTACGHVGLVATGRRYFEAMGREYDLRPSVAHYTCMIDLLGRAGHIDMMRDMVEAMPVKPDLAVWSCVLGACRTWGQVELGKKAFEHAVRMDRNDPTAYVMMANIYAAADMVEEASEMQAMRVESRAWKRSGRSWWMDTCGYGHTFAAGDDEHPEKGTVYAKLENLLIKMGDEELALQPAFTLDLEMVHNPPATAGYCNNET